MKLALVTGSSRGIGREIAKKLAKDGYQVMINYNHDKENASKTLEEVNMYSNGEIFKCDISSEEEVKKMIDNIINKYGRIDLLVNNASIANDMPINDKSLDEFKKIIDVNLNGTFIVSKIVSDYMLKEKQGNIINIASTNGIDTTYPESIDYDASKAGVISLTHNFANYCAPYIRVNAICPGWVNTDMNKEMSDEFKKQELNKILLNRFAEPNEIASLVSFIASDEAKYINDSIIRIDGGVKR